MLTGKAEFFRWIIVCTALPMAILADYTDLWILYVFIFQRENSRERSLRLIARNLTTLCISISVTRRCFWWAGPVFWNSLSAALDPQLSLPWRSLYIWRLNCSADRQCAVGPFMTRSTNLLIIIIIIIIIIKIVSAIIAKKKWNVKPEDFTALCIWRYHQSVQVQMPLYFL